MISDIDRFYALLGRLASLPGQGRPLRSYTGRDRWPERGVCFFREPGELRAGGNVPRIVFVGTHAVTRNSRSTLWRRLHAHRGAQDGRGNHRGSIFRLHVGAALLRRNGAGEVIDSWGVGQSAPRAVREREVPHERRVSSHIGSMSVLWVAVLDEPGATSARAFIKRNAIALLSRQGRRVDPPSGTWLGLHSERDEIRRSGLWNLDHVMEDHDPAFLDVLEESVDAMEGGR